MLHFEVTATVTSDDVTTFHAENVRATDPDDACGNAIGALRGVFGDDAEILVKRIVRQNIGGAACAAGV